MPDEDSDEWEDEYRRQFELAKKRHAAEPPAKTPPSVAAAPPDEEPGWAALTGRPDADPMGRRVAGRPAEGDPRSGDPRLARHDLDQVEELDRHEQPADRDLSAKESSRIMRNIAGRPTNGHGCSRRSSRPKPPLPRKFAAKSRRPAITVEGLIELIDIAERLPVLPIKAKLAELDTAERNLRVFETDDPAVLMVLEKAETGRGEYGIERDEGLVADLRFYARALELA